VSQVPKHSNRSSNYPNSCGKFSKLNNINKDTSGVVHHLMEVQEARSTQALDSDKLMFLDLFKIVWPVTFSLHKPVFET